MKNLAQYIDHTALKAMTTESEIKTLCAEAREYNFKTVCVPTCYVALAHKELEGTEIGVTTVVGFPLGNETSAAKAFEAKEAVQNGASDVDMVINVGALKDQKLDYVKSDIEAVVKASKEAKADTIVKVIVETCYLTNEEIAQVTEIVAQAGADFIKTSTGFGTGGATVEHVTIMRENAKGRIQVKASGGISDAQTAQAMIDAGATRLGVSKSIAIVTGQVAEHGDY